MNTIQNIISFSIFTAATSSTQAANLRGNSNLSTTTRVLSTPVCGDQGEEIWDLLESRFGSDNCMSGSTTVPRGPYHVKCTGVSPNGERTVFAELELIKSDDCTGFIPNKLYFEDNWNDSETIVFANDGNNLLTALESLDQWFNVEDESNKPDCNRHNEIINYLRNTFEYCVDQTGSLQCMNMDNGSPIFDYKYHAIDLLPISITDKNSEYTWDSPNPIAPTEISFVNDCSVNEFNLVIDLVREKLDESKQNDDKCNRDKEISEYLLTTFDQCDGLEYQIECEMVYAGMGQKTFEVTYKINPQTKKSESISIYTVGERGGAYKGIELFSNDCQVDELSMVKNLIASEM